MLITLRMRRDIHASRTMIVLNRKATQRHLGVMVMQTTFVWRTKEASTVQNMRTVIAIPRTDRWMCDRGTVEKSPVMKR